MTRQPNLSHQSQAIRSAWRSAPKAYIVKHMRSAPLLGVVALSWRFLISLPSVGGDSRKPAYRLSKKPAAGFRVGNLEAACLDMRTAFPVEITA